MVVIYAMCIHIYLCQSSIWIYFLIFWHAPNLLQALMGTPRHLNAFLPSTGAPFICLTLSEKNTTSIVLLMNTVPYTVLLYDSFFVLLLTIHLKAQIIHCCLEEQVDQWWSGLLHHTKTRQHYVDPLIHGIYIYKFVVFEFELEWSDLTETKLQYLDEPDRC